MGRLSDYFVSLIMEKIEMAISRWRECGVSSGWTNATSMPAAYFRLRLPRW